MSNATNLFTPTTVHSFIQGHQKTEDNPRLYIGRRSTHPISRTTSVTQDSFASMEQLNFHNAIEALDKMKKSLQRIYERKALEAEKQVYLAAKEQLGLCEKVLLLETEGINDLNSSTREKIDQFLNKALFLKTNESITSSDNRDLIQKLIPRSLLLFKKIEDLEELEKKSLGAIRFQERLTGRRYSLPVFSPEKKEKSMNPEQELFEKLTNEFTRLRLGSEIFLLYQQLVENLSTKLLETGTSLECKDPDNELLKKTLLMMSEIHDDPKINLAVPSVIENWMKSEFKKMVATHQNYLLRNINSRASDITSLNMMEQRLKKNLFENPLKNPSDIMRALNGESFHLIYEGVEIHLADKEASSKYQTYLNSFSRFFFDTPDLFGFLSDQIAQLTPSKEKMYSNYNECYSKLMSLKPDEKAQIKKNTLQEMPNISFEKALKYFKLAQNFLGQGIVYLIPNALCVTYYQKFKKTKLNLVKPTLTTAKNQIHLNFAQDVCQIQYLRKDGYVSPNVLLTTCYSFTVTKSDGFKFPKKLEISIDCPRAQAENEEIKDFLFISPFIMQSMGLQSKFKINYT